MGTCGNNEMTKVGEYSLTAPEQRLMEILLDPQSIGLSVTKICERADISRQAYYQIIKRDEFKQALNRTIIDLLGERIAGVLNASIKVALKDDPRGFNDRKMLLQMAGLLNSEDAGTKVNVNIIGQNMTSEQRKERLLELLQLNRKGQDTE